MDEAADQRVEYVRAPERRLDDGEQPLPLLLLEALGLTDIKGCKAGGKAYVLQPDLVLSVANDRRGELVAVNVKTREAAQRSPHLEKRKDLHCRTRSPSRDVSRLGKMQGKANSICR